MTVSKPDIQALIEEARVEADAQRDLYRLRSAGLLNRLAAALSSLSGETETEWGVKHSQGTNWCRSERDAREQVASFVARDSRSHHQTRGIVRLVKREQGPVIEVENPYESEVTK